MSTPKSRPLSPWKVGAFVSLWTAAAAGQTWEGGRTTPAVTEIVAVDATGEPNWLYGFEDLAGDGTVFKQQEQSIDVRTAYAATDAQRFWARMYVSDTQTPGGNVTGYVFIDADLNPATGGKAIATTISPQFTTDTSPGGYEYVLELPGAGSTTRAWHYQGGQYVTTPIAANNGAAESGIDLDPIRLNTSQHGYLQVSVDLALLGLTRACGAYLYFRSVNSAAAIGESDLEVGRISSCIPVDANKDGVPDVLVPPTGCISSAECAAGGICQAGVCVFGVPCVTAADCGTGMTCTVDGRCVPVATGTCTTSANCSGGLVCVAGQCTACTLGGTQCGAGYVCGPGGLCIPDQGLTGTCSTTANCASGLACANGQCAACTSSPQCGAGQTCGPTGRCGSGTGAGGTGAGGSGAGGLTLAPGEEVKGGAWNCAIPRGRTPSVPAGLLVALPLLLSLRRRARRAR